MALRANAEVLGDLYGPDAFQTLEAENAGLVLLLGGLEGLEDLAAGRVLDEAELDRELAAQLAGG
jgi:hypothetical protein